MKKVRSSISGEVIDIYSLFFSCVCVLGFYCSCRSSRCNSSLILCVDNLFTMIYSAPDFMQHIFLLIYSDLIYVSICCLFCIKKKVIVVKAILDRLFERERKVLLVDIFFQFLTKKGFSFSAIIVCWQL